MATYALSLDESATHGDSMGTQMAFANALLDPVSVADPFIPVRTTTAEGASSVSVDDGWLAGMSSSISISDAISGSDSGEIAALHLLTVGDSLSLLDGTQTNMQMAALMIDAIREGVILAVAGEEWEGYAINQANGAASRYTNWNFNSYAKLGEQIYACGNGGVYRIEGKTDDGEQISALASTGNIKIAGGLQTRIKNAYLMVRNDGYLLLSVINQGNSSLYQIQRVNEYLDQTRVKLDGGPKSAIWRFELANENGSDFDLDAMKIYPLALSRRQ